MRDRRAVELIGCGEVAGRNGVKNLGYGLHRSLAERVESGLDWLRFRPYPSNPDVLPWFWRPHQRLYAADWNRRGGDFVAGPCLVFSDARRPRIDSEERAILDARHCRLMFCHSEWYRRLILSHRRPSNRAPVVIWPSPIDPWPPGPATARFDLLVYAKSGYDEALVRRLQEAWPRSAVLRYGRFRRQELHDLAHVSRACVYLSDNDHGPLALEEILLAGCPAVGIPTGAPFIEEGTTGYYLASLPSGRRPGSRRMEALIEHVRRAHTLDRAAVRAAAARRFSTARIVDDILAALDSVR